MGRGERKGGRGRPTRGWGSEGMLEAELDGGRKQQGWQQPTTGQPGGRGQDWHPTAAPSLGLQSCSSWEEGSHKTSHGEEKPGSIQLLPALLLRPQATQVRSYALARRTDWTQHPPALMLGPRAWHSP